MPAERPLFHSIDACDAAASTGKPLRHWLSFAGPRSFLDRNNRTAGTESSAPSQTTMTPAPSMTLPASRAPSYAAAAPPLLLPAVPGAARKLRSSSMRRVHSRSLLSVATKEVLHAAAAAAPLSAGDQDGKAANSLVRELDLLNQMGICAGVCTYMSLFLGSNAFAALENGGAGLLLYGFVFASVGFTVVSASLAELTSACPTASGLYFYTARLAPKRLMPYLSFMTGFLNVLGAIAGLALVAQVCANLSATMWHLATIQPVLHTGPAADRHGRHVSVYVWSGGHMASEYDVLGLFSFFVVLCGALNLMSIKASAWITSLAAFCAFLSGPIMVVTILLVAPTHQPASYVFGDLALQPEVTGVSTRLAAFVLGTTTSVSLLYGSDSSLYMCEETRNPTMTAPRGIFWGMVITSVLGTLTVIGFMFAVQDPRSLLDPSAVTAGTQWGAQGLWDIFAARYGGDGRGSLGLLAMMGLADLLSLIMWMLGTARKVYSMARDQLLPGSAAISSVSVKGVPVNAMLLIVSILLLTGPLLQADQAGPLEPGATQHARQHHGSRIPHLRSSRHSYALPTLQPPPGGSRQLSGAPLRQALAGGWLSCLGWPRPQESRLTPMSPLSLLPGDGPADGIPRDVAQHELRRADLGAGAGGAPRVVVPAQGLARRPPLGSGACGGRDCGRRVPLVSMRWRRFKSARAKQGGRMLK